MHSEYPFQLHSDTNYAAVGRYSPIRIDGTANRRVPWTHHRRSPLSLMCSARATSSIMLPHHAKHTTHYTLLPAERVANMIFTYNSVDGEINLIRIHFRRRIGRTFRSGDRRMRHSVAGNEYTRTHAVHYN